MAEVERLITVVDLDDRHSGAVVEVDDGPPAGHSAFAHLYAELTSGRRLVLFNDRGWSSGAPIASGGRTDVEDTARMVVGPDEPGRGWTREQTEAGYWQFLEGKLQDSGIVVSAGQLRGLPHDVEIGERLSALLAENS